MHKWIKDNVNLSQIDEFHAVYDPNIRAVRIFVRRNGITEIDTNLVFFIDRHPSEAWMVHDNQDSISGHKATVSTPVRRTDGTRTVYTADYLGFIWELEKANKNDDGNGYYAGFKTPALTFGNPRSEKHYRLFRLITQPEGNFDMTVKYWIDGLEQTSQTISLAGTGGTLPFVLGTDLLGGQELVDSFFEIDNTGKRIQVEVFNSSANEDFFISQILIDFKNLGAKLN